MKLDYRSFLHILFPLSEDELILQNLHGKYLTGIAHPAITDGIVTLLNFKQAQVRAAIHLTKFHNHRKAKILLKNVLRTYIVNDVNENTILIPIPLSKKRLRERGYNQVTEVAKPALVKIPHILFDDSILIRVRNTPPQTSLKREQRVQNMADAFGVSHVQTAQEKINGKRIILLDDVMTTGATLKAAAATLRPHNPTSITLLAIAH